MVKKLKYLLFLIPFLFIENVFAHPYQLTFSSFYGGGSSYNIQSNNTQSIVYNVPFSGNTTNYEWTSSNSPTCSSTAVVSGIVYIDNTSFGVNNDDIGWARVYIRSDSNTGATNCSISVSDNGTRYVCTSSSLSSSFIIGYTLSPSTPALSLNHVITRNVDINCDTSTGQIIDNQNANTQSIINNQNSNTQSIINNNTQNSQNIINNQNANTQDVIDNQNANTQAEIDSQKVCSYIDKNSIFTNGRYLENTGSISQNSNFGITDYIDIVSSQIKVVTVRTGNASTCFYNANKTLISCIKNSDMTVDSLLTIPANSQYLRASINKSDNAPTFNVCKNGNQALNDSFNNLNDSITSESQPNTNQDIQDMDDMVASDTPITDLITMPLTLINAYINGVNSTCSPVNLGSLLGTNLSIPCINLEQRLGSNLWNTIDILCCIFLCYEIAMLFVSAFDGITSLRDDFEGLYQPKHAYTGYVPKHGGGN